MQSSYLAFEFDSGHDYMRTGLTQSTPNTCVSSTPAMQPFSEMGNFLECMDYSSGGGNASSSAGGLHNSLEFGMPTMPNLPFPMDKMQSMNCFDDYPVPERVASSSSRTSGPISSAHHSEMGSPSRASSQSSRPPYVKPFQDSGPCPYSIQEHKAVVGGQEGWYSFKCNPTTDPSACPKTPRIHLEGLEQTRRKDAGALKGSCAALMKSRKHVLSLIRALYSQEGLYECWVSLQQVAGPGTDD